MAFCIVPRLDQGKNIFWEREGLGKASETE